ncbi:MAG: PSD1 and planctomycete cytochrome C domain-containing protein [Fuerstiella sp.]|nr:PSD1 and planctomycete cytochrome C domain-containing protein [Fuerstiella sp.]
MASHPHTMYQLNRMRFCLLILTCLATIGFVRADEAKIHFDRDIRPILSDNCYTCHGPDEQARESVLRLDIRDGAMHEIDGKFALVPGKPEESELIRRILSEDQDEIMPPATHRKKLTQEQKQLLVTWVRQGAIWSDQWAWSPPQRSEPPIVNRSVRVRNWIDQFIQARLQNDGIEPSPESDRRILIRRLSFDLLGLPPTLDQVDAVMNSSDENSWSILVDELLRSPRFGERMAVQWLDLVRYADSVGYHGDQDVSISPYRDYVIDAFNSNMPFDQFTREQIGGDLLPNPTRDQLVASGYNKLGMMSAEGGVQPKEYLAKYAADRVRTAGSVWLGSTIGCAECHDHKFDPFTTKDFYRFAAFFADIKEEGLAQAGNWGPSIKVPDDELPTLLDPIREQIETLNQILTKNTPELEAAQRDWEQFQLKTRMDWQQVEIVSAAATQGSTLTIQDDGSIVSSGPVSTGNTYTVVAKTSLEGITGIRLEVLPDESLPHSGPGRAKDGNFVLSELRVEAAGAPVRLQNAQADFEQTTDVDQNPYKVWNAASVIDGDEKGSSWGWAVAPQFGRAHNLIVETIEPVSAPEFTFRLEQNHDAAPDFSIGRFRLWVTTARTSLLVDPIMKQPADIREILLTVAESRTSEQHADLAAHFRSIASQLNPIREQLAKLMDQQQRLTEKHTRTTLISVSVEPREMRVLGRGDWMDISGEVVQPGVPRFLPQIDSVGRLTRLDLANWLVSDLNPLTARVFVNRLWKMFYGTGISRVLDDIGSQGEAPVYPELLDTLAVEFMESGWDVKHMIRLMVTSAAYRQSSLMRDDLRDVDPNNRLLARQSRFRLEAEFVRDNALSVSGLLVHRLGGRSAKPYQPVGLYRHLNFPARKYQSDGGTNQYRRGVYTHWQRQFLHPAMKSFDAPPREECTAERPQSNTPLAALVLLNDPSYVEAARVFAERAIRQGGTADTGRLDWIMRRALSRSVQQDEAVVLQSLLDSQRQHYTNQSDAAKQSVSVGLHRVPDDINSVELAAWTAVTRAVFNMHEFITRN